MPREIRGAVELTPEIADHIAAVLSGGRLRTANRLVLPAEVLAAVGVSSPEELTVSFEHGRIVLTPQPRRLTPRPQFDAPNAAP